MKSFFSRLQTGTENKKHAVTDEELQNQLNAVKASLQKMRKSSAEDFPLLNESTRLGRHWIAWPRGSFPQGHALAVYKVHLILQTEFMRCPR